MLQERGSIMRGINVHYLESFRDSRFLYGSLKPSGFLLSPLQRTVTLLTYWRNCKRLREFEEIKISRQSCRGNFWIARRKTLKTFVWISSKNSALGKHVRGYWSREKWAREYENMEEEYTGEKSCGNAYRHLPNPVKSVETICIWYTWNVQFSITLSVNVWMTIFYMYKICLDLCWNT